MKRLIENTVFSGFVIAWRLAGWPTRRSPFFAKPTTDGVVRAPSAFAMTTGSPPCMIATQELVVPRSIPITFSAAIFKSPFFGSCSDFLFVLRFGDPDPARANKSAVQEIAALHLVDD